MPGARYASALSTVPAAVMPVATTFVQVDEPSDTTARRSHVAPDGMKPTATDSAAVAAESAEAETIDTPDGAGEADASAVMVAASLAPDAPRSFTATARA